MTGLDAWTVALCVLALAILVVTVAAYAVWAGFVRAREIEESEPLGGARDDD